jgi:23S rRNA pseudouridine1911/1915/1917 synthase
MGNFSENLIEKKNNRDSDEMYVHKVIKVDAGQELLRIDKFLLNRLENISRTKIQAGIDVGNVLVNDKKVKSNYKIHPNDVISIVLAEEPVDYFLVPEKLPLDIVYEDDDVAMVNKVAGMVVHPGVGNYTGTLVNGLLYHFLNDNGQNEIAMNVVHKKGNGNVMGDIRPFLVHRIDKNTSGLLVVAKNELAMEYLSKQFFYHTIQRKYIALVWGDLKNETGTIIGNIGRSPKDRQKFCVFDDNEHGKHAITHYKVLERFNYVTLIECQLETGRTHQIRVHMQSIGHPLFNDETYGGDKIVKGTIYSKYKQFVENCFTICNRQALHAKSLGFVHPTTQKFIEFETPIPADMQEVIGKWRKYVEALKD